MRPCNLMVYTRPVMKDDDSRRFTLPNGSVIHSDPDIHSGTPVFVGTRVPAQTFLDYLEGGYDLDEFLDHFPSVHRKQAITFLEQAGQAFS